MLNVLFPMFKRNRLHEKSVCRRSVQPSVGHRSCCGDERWGYFSADPMFLQTYKNYADQPWKGDLQSSRQNNVVWVFFVSYLVLLAFIFLLMPLPWLVSCPRALTSAPPVLCLVCWSPTPGRLDPAKKILKFRIRTNTTWLLTLL